VAVGDAHPIADEALANTSYLVDIGGGRSAIVDPRRDVDEYLALAERLGLRISASLETHLHADFVSGSRELARATGAEVFAPKGSDLRYGYTAVGEDDTVTVGEAAFDVLHTPGHTPEHVAYLLAGPTKAVFTGGSLIAGGAARTDLTGAERALDLARAQYRSLRRIAGLGNEVRFHPTHGAGSFCSTGSGGRIPSTIGEERRNPLLAAKSEDEFVERLILGFGSYPPYFNHLREVNRNPSLLAGLPSFKALTPAEATDAVDRGAWLIDGRPVDAWAAEHPSRAVSIAVRPDFASWLGWVVPFGQAVVLLVEPDQLEVAVRLCHRIGYDRIVGWVEGGIQEWRTAGLPYERVEVVPEEQAARLIEAGSQPLDVRQNSEWRRSRIPGAIHLELGDIIAGKRPAGDSFVTYCGHGQRSATAASLLARDGIQVAGMAGGIAAWERAGLPIER
jgi:hydroxyacylglutathione hydrolase